MEGVASVGTGTLIGGATAAMMGGSFGEGASQGAWTSTFGFLFNQVLSKSQLAEAWMKQKMQSGGVGTDPGFLLDRQGKASLVEALEVTKDAWNDVGKTAVRVMQDLPRGLTLPPTQPVPGIIPDFFFKRTVPESYVPW